MHRAHARVPAPEIYHFLDRTDADGVDERDGAGFGEGGPFGVFSGHEEVEGELLAHLGRRLVMVWEHFRRRRGRIKGRMVSGKMERWKNGNLAELGWKWSDGWRV